MIAVERGLNILPVAILFAAVYVIWKLYKWVQKARALKPWDDYDERYAALRTEDARRAQEARDYEVVDRLESELLMKGRRHAFDWQNDGSDVKADLSFPRLGSPGKEPHNPSGDGRNESHEP